MVTLWLLAAISATPCALAQAPADVWQATPLGEEVHPCLMFGPQDIPDIRERLQRAPYSGWWRSVSGSGDIVSQAFTWLITGDREKAEAVRTQLLRCYPSGYHCCCGVADALQGVAEAYDLVHGYEGLTAQDHRVIRAKMAAACERLYLSALETGAGQHPGNQRTRGLCALGTAAIVLKGYRDAAHTPLEWLQRALDGIHQEANLEFWRPDGMFIEGPGYSSFTLSVMLPFARYYHQACGKWLFDDPRLRNALHYLIYVTQPDGLANAFGTTNMCRVVGDLRLCVGAGAQEDQSLYRWAIQQWSSLSGGGVRDIGLFEDAVQPSTAGFPTTRFFPVSQEAAIRSDWSSHAVALWFKGKDPWLAARYPVYSHGDVGSFILHAYGELLAVDAGYDHWVSYNLYPPDLHNTLLVDGNGPVNATAGLLTNTLGAEFLQAGDITSTYAGIDLRRTFLMVDGRYAVIADDVRASAEHDYAWQIHTPVTRPTGEVRFEGNRASWTGYDPRSDHPGQVRLEAVWAGPVALTATDTSRWQPFGADPKNDSYDNWALVATQHGADVRYLTLLYPHPDSLAPPRIETPTVPGARCIVVTDGATRDTFIATEAAGVTVGDITTSARTCAVRERIWAEADGPDRRRGWKLAWLYLSGPGRIEYQGKLVAEIVSPNEGALALSMDHDWAHEPGAGLGWDGNRPEGPVLWTAGLDGARVTVAWQTAVGGHAPPAEAWARESDGEWGAVGTLRAPADGQVVLTLPEGSGATGPILLASQPPSPETPEPGIARIIVDGAEYPLAALTDLGRVLSPPRLVRVDFAALGVRRPRAALDGVPCSGLRLPGWDGEGPVPAVEVQIPEVVGPADHELVVSALGLDPLPRRVQWQLRFSMRPLLVNGDFERGGKVPEGWSCGMWSGSGQYAIEGVRDNPHSGSWCLMMRGLSAEGGLNMVASQIVPVQAGKAYVLSGWYRGEVSASASLCTPSGREQYIWMPTLKPSAKWAPFSWEFTVQHPDANILGLRTASVGAAWFDDVRLDEAAPR